MQYSDPYKVYVLKIEQSEFYVRHPVIQFHLLEARTPTEAQSRGAQTDQTRIHSRRHIQHFNTARHR